MAFRASNVLPQAAYTSIRGQLLRLKQYLNAQSSQMGATGYNSDRLMDLVQTLAETTAAMTTAAATPGIVQYARDQEDDQSYNVAAEFTSLQALIDAAIVTITNAIPKSNPGDYLALYTLSGTNQVARTFTVGQMAAIKTELDGIIASIA